jgi:hypothetical protein
VEHHPDHPVGHRPVIGLEPVIVQPDQRSGHPIGPVGLDHLPATRDPLPPPRLDERPPVIGVDNRVDQRHTDDDV